MPKTSRNPRALAAIAVVYGALLLPTAARAQDDVTLSMARERFKEGVAYFDKKDFAKARVAFLQAYALKKHPAVLINLAQSELRSGHEAEAAKHFAQYLREQPDASASERQSAETGLSASKALVAEVTLDIDTTGADVYVDNELEGTAPLPGPIYVMPGAHDVQARKEGKVAKSPITASAGQSTALTLRLGTSAPKAAAPAPERTETDAASESEPAPETPAEEPTATHGGRKGFFPWLVSKPGPIVGASLTGVGLIGGGAFALGARSAYNAADSLAKQIGAQAKQDGKGTSTGACVAPAQWLRLPGSVYEKSSEEQLQQRASEYTANCNKYSDNTKSGDTFKKLSIVSFAVGGAAAVGTIIYYFVDSSGHEGTSRNSPGPKVLVLPLYQPGLAGGVVMGTF